jgi:hypothetical protein
MYLRLICVALVTSTALAAPAVGQTAKPYAVQRTADGHPDFQGVWGTLHLTLLERPQGVEHLVADPEQARAVVETIRRSLPSLIDPDFHIWNISQLALVKGEYRTSLIVEPADGRMPLTQAGVDLSARIRVRDAQEFDHPEQRPLLERCLKNYGAPPIITGGVFTPYQIVQNREHVVIVTEGPVGVRIIRLGGQPPADAMRTVEGYSTGQWEGDTLVVQTTHLRGADPAHFAVPRPLLLSRHSRITERFTRASQTELFYQFTVEDSELYTRPWAGEFSFQRHDGPIYEFSCHEGNYSLPNILRGGQAEAARRAEEKSNRH